MAQGPFDDLDIEESEVKECTSMALASGQWMNEQCNKGNFIICEKNISGKPIKLLTPLIRQENDIIQMIIIIETKWWANNHLHLQTKPFAQSSTSNIFFRKK